MGQGAMVLGMLVRRQVTPRWENDHNRVDGSVDRGGCGQPNPQPPDGKKAEVGEGRSGLRRVFILHNN